MPKRVADDEEPSATATKKSKQATDASEPTPDGQWVKDAEGKSYLDLGGLKRAAVNTFKGKSVVDIREYYMDKNSGDVKPGKKGITLNSEQLNIFASGISALTEKLEAAQAEEKAESSQSKKPAAEKATKAKKREKPAKKKKQESEGEASAED